MYLEVYVLGQLHSCEVLLAFVSCQTKVLNFMPCFGLFD